MLGCSRLIAQEAWEDTSFVYFGVSQHDGGHHSSMKASWDFPAVFVAKYLCGFGSSPSPALSSSDVALIATLHLVTH